MVFQALADLLGFGTQDTVIDGVGSQTGAPLAFDGDLCAAGTTPNKDRTQCVVDPSVCANGTLADGLCTIDPVFDSAFCATGTTPSNNECVAELACGPGTKRVGDQCVAEAPVSGDPVFDSAFCAAGTTPSNNECVAELACGPGTIRVGDQCVAKAPVSSDPVFDSAFCATGTTPSNNECVAELACGPGTKRVGDQCVVGCEDGYVFSEDHVCVEKPWPEFERCRFYDFMNRQDDRNKGAAVCPNSFAEFDNIEKDVDRMTEEIDRLKIENRDMDNEISGLESKVSNLQNKVNNLERQKAHIMKKCSLAVKPAAASVGASVAASLVKPAGMFKGKGKPIAISIRSKRFDMKYCTDAGNRVVCTTPRMKQWETFWVHPTPMPNNVLLKGGKERKWCRSTPSGLKCDSKFSSNASVFDIVRNSKNAHALRTADGKYCSVENDGMICNRDHFQNWESLSIRPAFRHLGPEHKRLQRLIVAEPLNGYSKKFIVNPGHSDKPKEHGMPSNDLAGCQALAMKKGYAAVGFRTEAHPGRPAGRWKNSCFYYTKADASFQGNDADAAHQVACANKSKLWPHC